MNQVHPKIHDSRLGLFSFVRTSAVYKGHVATGISKAECVEAKRGRPVSQATLDKLAAHHCLSLLVTTSEAVLWRLETIVAEPLGSGAAASSSRANYLRHTDGKLWGKPANGVESRYVTGMASCGACGGGMLVYSRKGTTGRDLERSPGAGKALQAWHGSLQVAPEHTANALGRCCSNYSPAPIPTILSRCRKPQEPLIVVVTCR